MIKKDIHFRIAVIGSHLARVSKVISILQNNITQDGNPWCTFHTCTTCSIHVEYVPCVATFDSYQNEDNESIRYLMKIEHFSNSNNSNIHSITGTSNKGSGGSSLATFFDEIATVATVAKDDNNNERTSSSGSSKSSVIRIPGITSFAIGCGIELPNDIEQITSFINTLSSSSSSQSATKTTITIKSIPPNDEFQSMREENIHYKSLSKEEKDYFGLELKTLGPGKMANFVNGIVQDVVNDILNNDNGDYDAGNKNDSEQNNRIENDNQSNSHKNDDDHDDDECPQLHLIQNNPSKPIPTSFTPSTPISIKQYHNNQNKYACKICRSILFAQEDLEYPLHMKSQHHFSKLKMKKSTTTMKCNSLFLNSGSCSGLEWMGDISEKMEGKINCYKCDGKLGVWKWTGCQCSCGKYCMIVFVLFWLHCSC